MSAQKIFMDDLKNKYVLISHEFVRDETTLGY